MKHLLRSWTTPHHSLSLLLGVLSNCGLKGLADVQIEQADPRVLRIISMLGEEPIHGWTCPPTVLLLNKGDRIKGPAQPHLQSLIQRLEVHPLLP